MNGVHHIRSAGERLYSWVIIGVEQPGYRRLQGGEIAEQPPRQRILAIAPHAFNRVQFWTIRREKHQPHVARKSRSPCGMCAALVEHKDVQTIGKRPTEGVEQALKLVGIQRGTLLKEPLATGRRYRAREVKRLENMLDDADRLRAPRGQASPPDGQQPAAAFILAEDPGGTRIACGNDGGEPCAARALNGGQRVRFFCDGSDAGRCVWP